VKIDPSDLAEFVEITAKEEQAENLVNAFLAITRNTRRIAINGGVESREIFNRNRRSAY
jgi:hypothetical protein